MLQKAFFDKKYIGQKLKEYRKKANLTQESLAELVGIAEKHYGRLERGICLPTLDTFFAILGVLHIPLSDFGIQSEFPISQEREKLIKEIFLLQPDELVAVYEILKIIKNMQKISEEI